MIRVLELIDGGFIGGGQTHVLGLCANLESSEFETVIAASGKGAFKNLAESNGFKFREIELPKLYRSSNLALLDKLISEEKIDLVHSHGGVAGMYSRFHRKNYSSVPVVHTIHGIHYIHSANPLRRFLSKTIDEYLVKYCDAYICISEPDRLLATKLNIALPEKITVINNGVDLNRFKSRAHDHELVQELGLAESDFVIGMISRFDEQKNQRYLLVNSFELMDKFPDIKVLLAGSGKLFEECREIAEAGKFSERIIFTGEITDPERYYPLFDIFIFPTLWEGLSITLIEAMASERCILASNIEANKELIVNNENGLTFSVSDTNEFKTKLELLHKDTNLRARLAENALKRSREFSVEKTAKKTSLVYSKTSEDWKRG